MDPNKWQEHRQEAWQSLTPGEQERLRKAISVLLQTFGKRPNDVVILVWCKALAPYAKGSAIWRALAQACEGDKLPSINAVKLLMQTRRETMDWQSAPEPTPEERKRSDHAAILSMLWLHYEREWPLDSFAGHVLGRLFGKDPAEALRVALEVYDRPTVAKWMADQPA